MRVMRDDMISQSVLHGEGSPLRKCNDPCTSRRLKGRQTRYQDDMVRGLIPARHTCKPSARRALASSYDHEPRPPSSRSPHHLPRPPTPPTLKPLPTLLLPASNLYLAPSTF